MTTPTDRIPEFKLDQDRYTRREPVASREPGSTDALDAETLEMVQKFEALHAELASAAPTPPPTEEAIAAVDDLLIDLPDDLLRARTEEAAPAAVTPQRAERSGAAPAAAPEAAREPEHDETLHIDDAFAMLRAAESQGRANAERDAVDEEVAAASIGAREALRPLNWSSDRPFAAAAAGTARTELDWAGKARAIWPKVVGAAVIALVVGTGVGYIAGKAPKAGQTHAKIPVTPQGGAQLQFDYDLGKR